MNRPATSLRSGLPLADTLIAPTATAEAQNSQRSRATAFFGVCGMNVLLASHIVFQ
jgi:hypothetical protein